MCCYLGNQAEVWQRDMGGPKYLRRGQLARLMDVSKVGNYTTPIVWEGDVAVVNLTVPAYGVAVINNWR